MNLKKNKTKLSLTRMCFLPIYFLETLAAFKILFTGLEISHDQVFYLFSPYYGRVIFFQLIFCSLSEYETVTSLCVLRLKSANSLYFSGFFGQSACFHYIKYQKLCLLFYSMYLSYRIGRYLLNKIEIW